MSQTPEDGTDGPLQVVVKINGTKIPDSSNITSVATRHELGRVPEATVRFSDGDPSDEDNFEVFPATLTKPGNDIELAAGYGAEAPAILFKGITTALRVRVRNNEPNEVELICRDKAIVTTLQRRTKLFEQKQDGDVIKTVLSAPGVSATYPSDPGTKTDHVQHDATDWDFARVLADRNGRVMVTEAGKIDVRKPTTAGTPVLTVTYGLDMFAFDAEISARTQLKKTTYESWDPDTQKTVSDVGTAPTDGKWGNIKASELAAAVANPEIAVTTSVKLDQSTLKTAASARLLQAELARVRGTCRFQGNSAAKPDTLIELKGMTDRMNGTAYVTGVLHRLSAGDWVTETILGLDPEWLTDTARPGGAAAAGLAAPVHGLHIGKVTTLSGDPDNAGRIKIALSSLGTGTDEIWARYAAPYASNECGLTFLPEIHDEVVVAFLDNDPASPVILGSLHSAKSKRLASVATDEENNIKTIVTREKMRITFDEKDKIITIETPAENKITLSDLDQTIELADQTGNTIKMGPEGIQIESPKAISITAEATVDIKASGDATVSGMNVTVGADAQLSATGGGGGTVDGGPNLTLTGAIVNIN